MSVLGHKIAAQFLASLPLCSAMGLSIGEANDGKLAIILPYSKSLIGDPKTGVIHGGAVSVLLDTVCGAEVFGHPENAEPTATIDLRIDYMRPAKVGAPLYGRAVVYQTTRNVAFVRGTAWDEDVNNPVAMAAGAFTFLKKVAP